MAEPVPGTAQLRAEIDRRGLSPARAAREIGVTKQTMAEWLTEESHPKHANRIRIRAWSGGAILESSWLTREELEAISRAGEGTPAPEVAS